MADADLKGPCTVHEQLCNFRNALYRELNKIIREELGELPSKILKLKCAIVIKQNRKAALFLRQTGYQHEIRNAQTILIFKLPEMVIKNRKHSHKQSTIKTRQIQNHINWRRLFNRLRRAYWLKIHESCSTRTICLKRINGKGRHNKQYYYIFTAGLPRCHKCPNLN